MTAGATNYRNGIRAAATGLWTKALDFDQFYDAMDVTIRAGIPKAWHEGAKECGIKPADLSPTEKVAIQQAIAGELGHVFEFATWIEEHSKAAGGKLGRVGGTGGVMGRVDIWLNRYLDVVNRARVMACGDQPLEWVLGPTKKHCSSCSKLAGKVKRASQWERANVRPQNPPNWALECQGFNCLCSLIVTDKPLSRGPLPKLP